MSDRTQGQPRIVPTRPGWWWADMSKWHGFDALPEPLEAYIEGGRATFDGMDDDEPSEDQVTWIAPIPGPAVLAALAEYGEALLALDELNVRELRGAFGVLDSACTKLHAAIRAERDAERDGGA